MKTTIPAVITCVLLLQATSCNAFVRPTAYKAFSGAAKARQGGAGSLMVTPHGGVSRKKSSPKDHPVPYKETKTIERRATSRKKWGVDKDADEEYWFNAKIHTLGNTGFSGGLHAAMAPFATKMIDVLAYNGVNIREKVARELASMIQVNKARVADLCCGVGISTRALQDAFPDAQEVIGVDTSPEMLSMAQVLTLHESFVKPITDFVTDLLRRVDQVLHQQSMVLKKAQNKAVATCRQAKFKIGNAEDTQLESKSYDLVTVMYGFHEVPKKGRDRILREARRLLHKGGVLALIDISPDYEPSESMLKGEPYVKEYQKAIDHQLRSAHGFSGGRSQVLVPGHVNLWLLKRA